MARHLTVRVSVDHDLVLSAKEALGARNNAEAVELAIAIALAIREPTEGLAPFRELLRSDRFML